YGRAFHTAFNHKLSRHVLPCVNELGRVGALGESIALRTVVAAGLAYPLFRRLGFIAHACDRPLFDRVARDVSRLDFRVYHIIMGGLDTHDASDVLAAIRVPTLILAGERDVMTP